MYRIVFVLFLAFIVLIFAVGGWYVVQPGERGVKVTLGTLDPNVIPPGTGWRLPGITSITHVSVKQATRGFKAECFSADLQQVNIDLNVLYRVPENSVIPIFKDYAGDPFDSLIVPRVNEALKEVTAQQTAQDIVKKREDIKVKSIALARQKIGEILVLEDLVLTNIGLTRELEAAIEAKMVQEQEAAKAIFTKQKAQVEADTAVIKAEGEAKAIKIRGEALKDNPALVQLQIVEKWDGHTPLVVGGGGSGANILLPIHGAKP